MLESSDGGATWVTHWPTDPTSADFWSPWRFTFADRENGWAVGRVPEVFSTVDGGATWSASRSKGRGGLQDVTCVDAEHAWAVGGKGGGRSSRPIVVATRDGGDTWTTQTVPGHGTLYAVASADSRHAWAIGQDWERGKTFIVGTDDGGRQWRVQYRAKLDELRLIGIAFADARHGWAVGASINGHGPKDDTGVILATDDGGATWKEQFEASGLLRAVDCPDAQHVWVAGRDGLILATSDGGETWTEQQSGTSKRLASMAFSSTEHGWILVGYKALLATSDGGATWQLVALGRNVYFHDVAAARAAGVE